MTLRALTWVARWIAAAHDLWRMREGRRRPLRAEIDALHERVGRLEAENDLLRSRLLRLDPRRRPRWKPWERLRILLHRERYGLSLKSLARGFVVSRNALRRWKTEAEEGVKRLVATRTPLNRLPDLVREIARFVKRDWPSWGTRRIAGILARLGLKASRSSVQRILREPACRPRKAGQARRPGSLPRAKRPGHVYAIDFTWIGGVFRRLVVGAVIDVYS